MLTTIQMSDVIDPATAVLDIPKRIRQDDYGITSTIDSQQVTPNQIISLGSPFLLVKNGGKTKFTLKRFAEGYYVCSCPAWKFSSERDKLKKTCSHLKEVLGEEYETQRIRLVSEASSDIWQMEKMGRRESTSTVAIRHAQAKSLLDDRIRQMSQSQSQLGSEPAGRSLARTNTTGSSSSSSVTEWRDTNPRSSPPFPDQQQQADPVKTMPSTSDATANSRSSSPSNRSRKRGIQRPNLLSSDSETEEEEEEEDLLRISFTKTSLDQPKSSQITLPSSPENNTKELPKVDESSSNHTTHQKDHPSPPKKQKFGLAHLDEEEDDKVALLLAKPWQLDPDPTKPRSKPMDPTGWWVSEKLDGVRAYWDGHRLFSRQKIEWNAPAWWKNRLPKDITLDGELWLSRGNFDLTSRICRTTVRLGKIKSFRHFQQRESIERDWLREQVGGRIASQERLRQERIQNIRQRIQSKTIVSSAHRTRKVGWKRIKRKFQWNSSCKMDVKSRLSILAPTATTNTKNKIEGEEGGETGILKRKRQEIERETCSQCGRLKSPHVEKLDHHTDTSPAPPAPAPSNAPSSSRPDSPCCHSEISRNKKSKDWDQIKFMIFDAPSLSEIPVEERWRRLAERFGTTEEIDDIDRLEPTAIKLVHHVPCRGKDDLLEMLKQVDSKGGEGLMLRRPKSRYEFRRGNTLFKLKSFYDAEAKVVGYADGEGRNIGRVGTLIVEMECGTIFRVGSGLTDKQRHQPPPIGSIISYRFQEISNDGFPRFPSFRGVRHDKTKPKDAVLRPNTTRRKTFYFSK